MNERMGIYIHWPFCAAKCPYCDFNSHVRHTKIDQRRYVQAFERELGTVLSWMDEPSPIISSVFFGGGTPSLMEGETLFGILQNVQRQTRFINNVEISLEANPSSVEAARFASYKEAGVNRVSLGIQSFDDAALKFLGRLHNAKEAIAALEVARNYFDRTSFDLIYALPEQSLKSWDEQLQRALSFEPSHLSMYQLTIEPDTIFYKLYEQNKFVMPDEDLARAMFMHTQNVCAENGLPAYEISNHARLGQECEHNLIYWRGQDYIGIGPGAHGRIQIGGRRYATSTEKNPEQWLALVESQGHGFVEKEALSTEEICDEFLLMGLRLREGLDLKAFENKRGGALNPKKIKDLMKDGMLKSLENGRICVTREGSVVLDAVVADLAS